MNGAASKVIAFTPASGRHPVSDAGLLKDLRVQSIAGIGDAASRCMDKAADELAELAQDALDLGTRAQYQAQVTAWPQVRQQLEQRFRERLDDIFERRQKGERNATEDFGVVKASWSELSLVGDGDLEQTVRFSEVNARMRASAERELAAFDRRMALALGRPGMDPDENPLSPKAICDAFRDALAALDADQRTKLVLIRLFDDAMSAAVVPLYEQMNGILRSRGVLPDLSHGVEKKPVSGAGPAGGARANEPPTGRRSTDGSLPGDPPPGAFQPPATAGTQPQGTENIDPFAMLQQMMLSLASRPAMPAMAPVPAMPSGANPLGLTAGTGVAAPLVALPGGFLGSLTRLQQGDFSGLGADVSAALQAPVVASPAVAAPPAGAQVPLSTDPAALAALASPGVVELPSNVLQKLRGTSLASQMGQVDTVTLDIMAMLFDQIFGDPDIPAPMKALIGRLQIPMLKVAMMDKAFFSKKSHPARRMLDTLGELSLGLGEGFGTGSALYKNLERLIERVAEEFEDDMSLFDRLTAELEALVKDADATAASAAEGEARRIQEKERLELARMFAQNELRARAAAQPLPRAVLQFLSTEWMKLMILAYAKGGSEDRAWRSLLETMDLLIWSITPKQGLDDRRKLVKILPGLLKRLHNGMAAVGTASEARDRLDAVLMRCHARAIGGAASEPGAPRKDAPPQAAAASIPDGKPAAQASPRSQSPATNPAGAPEPGPGTADSAIPTLLPEPAAAQPAAARPAGAAAARPALATPLSLSADSMMVEEVPLPPGATLPAVTEGSASPAPEVAQPSRPGQGSREARPDSSSSSRTGEAAKPASQASQPMQDKPAPQAKQPALSAQTAQEKPEPRAKPLPQAGEPAREKPAPQAERPAESNTAPNPQAPAAAADGRGAQAGTPEPTVLQEDLAVATLPDSAPKVTVKNPFGEGEIELEEVSFGDEMPGVAVPVPGLEPANKGDRFTELAGQLKVGDWLEIEDDDGRPRQARLSYVSPYRTTFVFSNRKGQKIGEYSLYQLTRDLRAGRIRQMDKVALFDRAFGSLVGKLRSGAEQSA